MGRGEQLSATVEYPRPFAQLPLAPRVEPVPTGGGKLLPLHIQRVEEHP